MRKIKVKLKKNGYHVVISNDLKAFAGSLLKYDFSKIVILTSKNIARQHLKQLSGVLKGKGLKYEVIYIPDGERAKTLSTAGKLYSSLLKAKLDRKSGLIAFGGGVVGDICGFVASTYMRGIGFIQLPTTLLAQVDAAIGGKTAVNLPDGKNIVGTFYQPELVWSSTDFLYTLPRIEWLNGFAEVIKYGIIMNKGFFEFLERSISYPPGKRDIDKIVYISSMSKAWIVSEDEKETSGIREILNFGHTFGHVLESCSGYKGVKHGQAVSIGMVFASIMAEELKMFSEKDRVVNLLTRAGLPVTLPGPLPGKKWEQILFSDKKFRKGVARFVLPVKIGKVKVVDGISLPLIRKVVKKMEEGLKTKD